MHKSVTDIFPTVTKPLEGCVLWPYLDILGIPTVGYGCALESAEDAVRQVWLPIGGALLPPSDELVRQQWARLRAETRLSKLHFKYAEPVTQLRMSQQGADNLLQRRMLQFEIELLKWFPHWQSFCADGQLAIMLIAWAVGPAFPATFKNFASYVNATRGPDWENAAKCAAIRTQGNPGVVPRNAQVQLCLHNAALATTGHLDEVYWPVARLTQALASPVVQTGDGQTLPLAVMAQRALDAHPIDVLGYAGRGDPFTGSESDT